MKRSLPDLTSRFQKFTGFSPPALSVLKLVCWLVVGLVLLNALLYIAFKGSVRLGYMELADWLLPALMLFDVGREYNISSWFNAALWVLAAVLAWVVSATSKRPKAWVIFGLVCAYMSIDETMSIHEQFGSLAVSLFGSQTGLLNYEWVILGVVLAIVMAGLSLRAVWSLSFELRRSIILAGVVFVTGALFFEALSAWAIEAWGDQIGYHSLMWVEESLEMLGVALLIAALVSASYLRIGRPSSKSGTQESVNSSL